MVLLVRGWSFALCAYTYMPYCLFLTAYCKVKEVYFLNFTLIFPYLNTSLFKNIRSSPLVNVQLNVRNQIMEYQSDCHIGITFVRPWS